MFRLSANTTFSEWSPALAMIVLRFSIACRRRQAELTKADTSRFQEKLGTGKKRISGFTRPLYSVLLIVVFLALVLIGLKRSIPHYNIPANYTLFVANAEGGQFEIQVIATNITSFPVAPDGYVTFGVPRLPRSCCYDWFGITLVDNSPEATKAILILRNGKIIRRLSLQQLKRLPLIESGAYSISP